MKSTRLVIGAFALLMLLPLRVVAENINVYPTTHDYGQVEVGDTVPMSFSIESTGPTTPLLVKTITIVEDDTGSFSVDAIIPDVSLPHSLPVDDELEVVVSFTPSDEGVVSASLYIVSDALLDPFVFIPVQGEGIIIGPNPGELMEELVDTFHDGVITGEICGLGNGNSVVSHLRVFDGMLDAAEDLIALGDDEAACDQLWHAQRKCDGTAPPPDFIGCGLAPTIHAMIGEVMTTLGCD